MEIAIKVNDEYREDVTRHFGPMIEAFIKKNAAILSSDDEVKEDPDCVVVIAHVSCFRYSNDVYVVAQDLMQDILDVAREKEVTMTGFGKYVSKLDIYGGIRRTNKQSDDVVDKVFTRDKINFMTAPDFLRKTINPVFEYANTKRVTKVKKDIKFKKCKLIYLVNFDRDNVDSMKDMVESLHDMDADLIKFKESGWFDFVVVNLNTSAPVYKLPFKMMSYTPSDGKASIREHML